MSTTDFKLQPFEGANIRQRQLINQGWDFRILGPLESPEWSTVNLPHYGRLEPYDVSIHFQGLMEYQRQITPDPGMIGRIVTLEFEAGMQVADLYIDGYHRVHHEGGYLPFFIDITKEMQGAQPITVMVRLDNRDNPQVPPGKPLAGMDFCYWSGLYRNAYIHVTNPVHVSNAMTADKPGGGGIFVRYENVSEQSADVLTKVDVVNESDKDAAVKVHITVFRHGSDLVASKVSDEVLIAAGASHEFDLTAVVSNPDLWSPDSPELYRLLTGVHVDDDPRVIDLVFDKIGIRHLYTDPQKGLYLNGKHLVPFGANRHQAYPYIGNALSDKAQYRDAVKLKEAGFDIIRLSHYPHSPAFLDACDELGMLTLICIPGWQFFNNTPEFRANVVKDLRQTFRRDRNHPSAVLWELSLNETLGHDDLVCQLIEVADEEYPGDQLITCGDTEGHDLGNLTYDVPYSGWDGETRTRPNLAGKMSLHREYGDNQFGGYSRYTRGDGELLMLVQAWNFQTAVNDHNALSYTWGQCTWEAFDNNRGMSREIATCGVMDPFRLPKFMYYFYQSQADITRHNKPMIFIANYWQQPEARKVPIVVYSNTDEVELLINGRSVARQKPDSGPNTPFGDTSGFDLNYWKAGDSVPIDQRKTDVTSPVFTGGNCQSLKHPPFTFDGIEFEPGELTAIGYKDGKEVVRTARHTPGEPKSILLEIDYAERQLARDGADTVFVHASIVDDNGTVVPSASMPVYFSLDGDATLIGDNPHHAEAGIATILLRAGTTKGTIKIAASAHGLTGATVEIE